MTVPIDPGDFTNAPSLSTPVAAPYKADADLYDARFLVLYRYLDKTIQGVDASAIQDATVTRALVEAQAGYSTLALAGGTVWTPANLSYWKDSLGVVHFRPEKFTATADLAPGTTFGTMPAGFRPGVTLYFPCNRVHAGGGNGTMHFSLAANGVMTAEGNFNALTDGIAFNDVEYLAEN